jgi:hypothetical protein
MFRYLEQAANTRNEPRNRAYESSSFYVRVVEPNKLQPHKTVNTYLVKNIFVENLPINADVSHMCCFQLDTTF